MSDLTLRRIIWNDGRPSLDREDYSVRQGGRDNEPASPQAQKESPAEAELGVASDVPTLAHFGARGHACPAQQKKGPVNRGTGAPQLGMAKRRIRAPACAAQHGVARGKRRPARPIRRPAGAARHIRSHGVRSTARKGLLPS
jgi:hypothetical protein